MGIPSSSIPRNPVIPEGQYTFAIQEMEKTSPREDERLMILMHLVTVAPVAGLSHREMFLIGTLEDPAGVDPQTWIQSFAATRMYNIFDKAGVQVPDGTEPEELDQICRDYRFDGQVTHSVNDGKRNAARKGQIDVRLTPYEEGVLTSGKPGPVPVAPVPTQPPAQPGRPTMRSATPQQPRPIPRAPQAPQAVQAAQAEPPVAAGDGAAQGAEEVEPPAAAPTPPVRPSAPPPRQAPRRA